MSLFLYTKVQIPQRERDYPDEKGSFDIDIFLNQIDNYHFKGRGGTSFDLALKSFSKDKKINKIIFTDGYDTVTNSQENRKMKVIWIVYDNKNFKPCCGKVINVNSREMYFMKQESESEEFTQ